MRKRFTKDSQTLNVLMYLTDINNNGLTNNIAYERFGVTRLSGIIYNLRKMGYDIVCDEKVGVNRYGNFVKYGVYRMNNDIQSNKV